jgi:cytochrome P450
VAEAFEILLIVVVSIGVIGAVLSLRGASGLYDRIGKGAFSLDEPDRPKGPQPGSAAALAEAEAEIRQLVEAKSHRREARGESALDIEAEIAALTRPAGGGADDELRDEVRQLVIAGNERRLRRGQEPLDVEAEVDRQLRDLGG